MARKCAFSFGVYLFLPFVELIAFNTQFSGQVSSRFFTFFKQPNSFLFELFAVTFSCSSHRSLLGVVSPYLSVYGTRGASLRPLLHELIPIKIM